MLSQQTQTDAAGTYDVAAIWRFLVINQAKDGGLTRSVAADEPDVLARIYLQRRAAQDILRAVRLMYF